MKTTKNPHYAVKLLFVIIILVLGYFSKSYFSKGTGGTQTKTNSTGIALQ